MVCFASPTCTIQPFRSRLPTRSGFSRLGRGPESVSSQTFLSCPALASYWSDPAELVFNPSLQVQLNLDHIIRDNLNRFPGGAWRPSRHQWCAFRSGCHADIEAEPPAPAPAAPANPTEVPLATSNALEGAMKHSIRLAQRSYRVSVPQFHYGKIGATDLPQKLVSRGSCAYA